MALLIKQVYHRLSFLGLNMSTASSDHYVVELAPIMAKKVGCLGKSWLPEAFFICLSLEMPLFRHEKAGKKSLIQNHIMTALPKVVFCFISLEMDGELERNNHLLQSHTIWVPAAPKCINVFVGINSC